MTVNGADTGTAVGPWPASYLPDAVAAYHARVRGTPAGTFDPAAMRPRWRLVVAAAALLLAVVAAGLLTPVEVGSSGTLVQVDGRQVLIAAHGRRLPTLHDEVVLHLGDARLAATVVAVRPVELGRAPVPLIVVELDAATLTGESAVGSTVMLEEGHRPLLFALLTRGAR